MLYGTANSFGTARSTEHQRCPSPNTKQTRKNTTTLQAGGLSKARRPDLDLRLWGGLSLSGFGWCFGSTQRAVKQKKTGGAWRSAIASISKQPSPPHTHNDNNRLSLLHPHMFRCPFAQSEKTTIKSAHACQSTMRRMIEHRASRKPNPALPAAPRLTHRARCHTTQPQPIGLGLSR